MLAMVVVAQTPEIVEGYHLQVWPGKNVRQLFADRVKNVHPQLLFGALGKSFLLALGLLVPRRLIAGNGL
jgi:hypothetical protein